MGQNVRVRSVVLTVCAFVALATLASAATQISALAGTWTLNRGLSTLPERGKGGFGPRGGGPGGDRGFHGGPGGGIPHAVDGPGREGGPRRGPMASPAGAETLRIDLNGEELRIIAEDGHARILHTDGRSVEIERGSGTSVEKAEWKDNQLVVTGTSAQGNEVQETLALAEDGSGRFVQTLRFQRPDQPEPTTLRWVYERSK